jgi:3-oxoacyl-[acyl-carrier-protein] synthase II
VSDREVLVTGIGVLTPVGIGVEEFWTSLVKGRSGVGALTRYDRGASPIGVVAEVDGFVTGDYMRPNIARKLGRFAQLGVAASGLACRHAGLDPSSLAAGGVDPERAGVVVGTCYAGLEEAEAATLRYAGQGWRGVDASVGPCLMPNAAAAMISITCGIGGPVECVTTACATGAQAISRGADLIRYGQADLVLAGGCDAPLTPIAVSSFAMARALATGYDDDPTAASRPFEAGRSGFVMAEGAAVLVLEAGQAARARGARPLARFLGWGHSGDAHNIAQPRPDGAGAARAMSAALRMAGCAPADVGYVHAHATGTPLGDAAEARALHQVFDGNPPPASSTKSMTGHMMGAAGSAGAAAAVLAVSERMLPPTINYAVPDPACDLDVVPNEARPAGPDIALCNAFALGGINCSLVFGRP